MTKEIAMNYKQLIVRLNADDPKNEPLYHTDPNDGTDRVTIMRKKRPLFVIYKTDHRSIELGNFKYVSPAGTQLIMDFFRQKYTKWF